MLNTRDAEYLRYAYGATIRKVAGQVARQYAAKGGLHGHGYEVITADDVEQATYEQLIRSGVGVEALDEMDEVQGYIRTTARLYGAANQSRARRRDILVDFGTPDVDSTTNSNHLAHIANNVRYASKIGNPETENSGSDFIEEVYDAVLGILGNITSAISRAVAEHFYLDGLDANETAAKVGTSATAVRKALWRARGELGETAEASLRAWRLFAHPEAKRPQARDARPEALMALSRGL